jgi:preprotein translocase subunit SecA
MSKQVVSWTVVVILTHQAIEAKENVKSKRLLKLCNGNFAKLFQNVQQIRWYDWNSRLRLGVWEIYKLDVVEIPTNRPMASDKEDFIYKTTRENSMLLSKM